MPSRRRVVATLRRVSLAVWSRLPRFVLASVYRATMAVTARGLLGEGVSIFVRGGLARGNPVFGLSDIDLIALLDEDAPDGAEQALHERWERLQAWVPTVGFLVDLEVIHVHDVKLAATGPSRQAGLTTGTAVHFSRPAAPLEMYARPGVERLASEWRLLRGVDRLPDLAPWDTYRAQQAAWLELQHWWRYAPSLVLRAGEPRISYRALRLVTEPARAWLYQATGDHIQDRAALLTRVRAEADARGLLTDATHHAIELAERLNRDPANGGAVDPDTVVTWLAHVSAWTADEISAQLRAHSTTHVELVDHGVPTSGHHLVDWRAVVVPPSASATFVVGRGDACSAEAVAAAAVAYEPGAYVALRHGPILVKPVSGSWAGALWRTLHFSISDPVSFSQIDGVGRAAFVDAPGWSIEDQALRAVNEHRAFLAAAGDHWSKLGVHRLLTAVRAGVLADSLREGMPRLLVGTEAIRVELVERCSGLDWLVDVDVDGVLGAADDGDAPDQARVDSLRRAVTALPCYS